MPRRPIASGYFDPTVDYPLWCYPMAVDPPTDEDFLFNRRTDPAMRDNVWNTEPARRAAMLALVREMMREEGTPAEQFVRLGL